MHLTTKHTKSATNSYSEENSKSVWQIQCSFTVPIIDLYGKFKSKWWCCTKCFTSSQWVYGRYMAEQLRRKRMCCAISDESSNADLDRWDSHEQNWFISGQLNICGLIANNSKIPIHNDTNVKCIWCSDINWSFANVTELKECLKFTCSTPRDLPKWSVIFDILLSEINY